MCAMCNKARAGWAPTIARTRATPPIGRSFSAASSAAAAAAAAATAAESSLFSSDNPSDELQDAIRSLVSRYVQRTKTDLAIPTQRVTQLELALATEQSRVQMAHERSRELEQRVSDLEAKLAAAGGGRKELEERLVTVKQEKFEALETATIVAQQKRKAEGELHAEADKRQRAEAAAASSASSLAAAESQVESLQAANEQLESEKAVCCSCMAAPPSVLFAVPSCSHAVLCTDCSLDLVKRGNLACPKCRRIVPAKKRLDFKL